MPPVITPKITHPPEAHFQIPADTHLSYQNSGNLNIWISIWPASSGKFLGTQ